MVLILIERRKPDIRSIPEEKEREGLERGWRVKVGVVFSTRIGIWEGVGLGAGCQLACLFP